MKFGPGILGAFVAGALFLSPVAGAQSQTLRAADVHPIDYPTSAAVAKMGEKLDKATKGRLKIRMFPGGMLGDEKATIEQTQAGAIQINRISLGALGPVVPEVNVFNMPFVFRDVEHAHKVVDGPIGDEILQKISASPAKLIGLAFMDGGARSVYSKKEVRKPGDLKGMKFRMMGNPLFIDTMNAMGGSGVSMGTSETFSALQTGLIDGAENNEPTYWTGNHYMNAPVFSRTEHLILPEVLVFSKAAWDKLSAQDQGLIRTLAREAQMDQRKLWSERVARDTAALKAKNVKFVEEVDKKAFFDATAPVREKYGAQFSDLIDRIQKQQ